MSAIFLICLRNPIRKPVLTPKMHTQQESRCFRGSKQWQTWLGCQLRCSRQLRRRVFLGQSLDQSGDTKGTADAKADESFCEGELREARLCFFFLLGEDVFELHLQQLTMNIRQQMLSYFQQPEVHAKILDYVRKYNIDLQSLNEDELLRMLNDLQLLNDIQDKLQEQKSITHPSKEMKHNLNVTITKGRKFKQLMELERPTTFYFVLSAFSQKVRSASYPSAQNFAITEKLTVHLKTNQLKSQNSQNLQLLVVAVTPNDKKVIYSLKLVQWRFALAFGSLSVDLQLAPYHHEGISSLPCVGILSVTIQLTPLPKHFFLSEASLNRQLQLEQKLKESANKKFYAYANTFWNQIKNVHRSLQTRRIPIYAQTEDKVYYALPKLVTPLYGIRGIDSPHHALRFCSLIPFIQGEMQKQRSFRRFSTMLGGQAGLVEDHCHLLCSLLLGMGLKAYVCVGSTSKGQHSWVMSQSSNSITFWESTKGIKLDFFSPKALTYYRTINAVYNNKEYYANIQLDDTISGTKFNFKDSTLWKKMDSNILQELPSFNKGLSLAYPTVNTFTIQQNTQATLLELIQQHRNKLKLSFAHDEVLSSLLITALTNYQIERVTGQTFCQQEFQVAIKGYIPAKHTFKAFPIQLTTLEPQQIMSQLLEQPKAKQILSTKGQSVFFGLRTKLVTFPDNVFALWISLAIRYYRID